MIPMKTAAPKILKTQATKKAHRCYKATVWLDKSRNYRAYCDLDARETKWLCTIAAEFGLTIDEFIRRFYCRALPRPAYARKQGDDRPRKLSDLAMFKVTCSNPAVWSQLAAIAEYQKLKGGAEEECITSILLFLEMFNDDVLFSPKTGKVLCSNAEVDALAFRTGFISAAV